MWEDLIFDWIDLVSVLLIGGACTVLLYVAIGILREARATRRWPQTTGKVITSHAEARLSKPTDVEDASLPLVEYEYKIGAWSFRGWGIYISATANAIGLRSVRDQYPVGGQVIVRYNPAAPQQSILERDIPESELLGRFLLLLAVGMPVVALLLYCNVLSASFIFTVIFCSVVPVGLMVVMIAKYREVRAAQRWLQTTGTVVTSCVEAHKKMPGKMPGEFGHNDSAVTNSPHVVYEYKVTDQSFRGSRKTIGERTSDYELESIRDRYPVGAQVPVYYDPADPQQAVLERDVPASTFWIGGGCVLFAIVVPIIAILIYYQASDWHDGAAAPSSNEPLHSSPKFARPRTFRRWPTSCHRRLGEYATILANCGRMRDSATIRPRGGMADTGDLKSPDQNAIGSTHQELTSNKKPATAVEHAVDSDLARLIEKWPTLPAHLRAAIISIVG